MEYRAWKKQNGAGESIRTSLLGYGCMRFPTTPEGAIDEPRAEALLNAARDAGVNYFDTAYPYHGGQSEPFVGRVIAKWPRESFYLAPRCRCGSAGAWRRPSISLKSSSGGWAWSTSTSTCCTPCTRPGTKRQKPWALWTGYGSRRPQDASGTLGFLP